MPVEYLDHPGEVRQRPSQPIDLLGEHDGDQLSSMFASSCLSAGRSMVAPERPPSIVIILRSRQPSPGLRGLMNRRHFPNAPEIEQAGSKAF